MTKATNEIYQCDTKILLSSSYRCDIYVMSMVKTRLSPARAWQLDTKIPGSGDWANGPEDTNKTFPPPNQIMLYQDAVAVGDPVGVEPWYAPPIIK